MISENFLITGLLELSLCCTWGGTKDFFFCGRLYFIMHYWFMCDERYTYVCSCSFIIQALMKKKHIFITFKEHWASLITHFAEPRVSYSGIKGSRNMYITACSTSPLLFFNCYTFYLQCFSHCFRIWDFDLERPFWRNTSRGRFWPTHRRKEQTSCTSLSIKQSDVARTLLN